MDRTLRSYPQCIVKQISLVKIQAECSFRSYLIEVKRDVFSSSLLSYCCLLVCIKLFHIKKDMQIPHNSYIHNPPGKLTKQIRPAMFSLAVSNFHQLQFSPATAPPNTGRGLPFNFPLYIYMRTPSIYICPVHTLLISIRSTKQGPLSTQRSVWKTVAKPPHSSHGSEPIQHLRVESALICLY